jgi:hypothetical protein
MAFVSYSMIMHPSVLDDPEALAAAYEASRQWLQAEELHEITWHEEKYRVLSPEQSGYGCEVAVIEVVGDVPLHP